MSQLFFQGASFHFIAAVTVHSDFGAKENKICHCFHFCPIYVQFSLVAQSCLTLYNPRDCSLPGSSVPGDSLGKNTGVGCYAFLQGNLPNPGIKPKSPTLRGDSLLSEPPRKPNLDSVLKSRDITLPTKVHIVKAMFFQQSLTGMRPEP